MYMYKNEKNVLRRSVKRKKNAAELQYVHQFNQNNAYLPAEVRSTFRNNKDNRASVNSILHVHLYERKHDLTRYSCSPTNDYDDNISVI